MAVRTQKKHTRGHKEFSRLCREQGFEAVRCIRGHLDCCGLPGIHVSIRRTERLRMDDAMAQAAAEAGDRFPVLAHRSNHQPWRITMDLDTFFHLYRAFTKIHLPDPALPVSEPSHGSDPGRLHLPAEFSALSVSQSSPLPIAAVHPETDIV